MSDKSPDAFRTISEVADWLGVQPHVLRFWESKFSQVRPVKRAGGRRYYRPNDMLLLGGIRKLLHEDGLTIKGAQKVLREEGVAYVARMSQPLDPESAALSDLAAAMEEEARAARQDTGAPPEPQDESGQVLEFETSLEEPSPQPKPSQPAGAADPDADGSAAPQEQRASFAEPPQPSPTIEPVADATGGSTTGEDREAQMPETASHPDPAEEPLPEKAPIPSFMRDPGASRPPDVRPKDTRPVPDRLPSFLQAPPREAETWARQPATSNAGDEARQTEAELPLDLPTPSDISTPEPQASSEPVEMTPQTDFAAHAASEPETAPAPETESAPQTESAPKPKIVDAPDPDEASFDVAAGALSAAFAATSVSPKRRAVVLPLVAQLAALRDRMAAERN